MDANELQAPKMSGRKRPRLTGQDSYIERPFKRLAFDDSFRPFLSSVAKLLTFGAIPTGRTKNFQGYPGLVPISLQHSQYPDRYRPAYPRKHPKHSYRESTNIPSLVLLTMKLSNVLDTEGIPIHLLGYRDNPRNLPPHLHTILCMQEDYINSKVNSNEAYFRMLETSKGRKEMTKQARLHIKATLDIRLCKGRSKIFRANQNLNVLNHDPVKIESQNQDQAKIEEKGSRVCSTFDVPKKHSEVDMMGLERSFEEFQCS